MKRRESEDVIQAVMSKPVITIAPSALLSDALELLVKHDIGTLVVEEQKKIVGILTERDITRHLSKREMAFERTARNVMSSPVISATPDMPIWKAFELMEKNRIRRLPVLENEKLVGIVTERDLIRWVMKILYSQVPTAPREIRSILDRRRPA